MTQRSNNAQSEPIVSDVRVRDTLRRIIDRAINVERTFTRGQLAEESGVNIHMIDAIMTRDEAKQRRVALCDALSIASVLGERAVTTLVGMIGYVARPVEELEQANPMLIAANAMSQLAVIAEAAADGRIDHLERKPVAEAADALIVTVLPLSSHGHSN